MCRYFLKQKRVVRGLKGGVYGLDEVCELAAMVESTKIRCFIFLMLGVFFEIRGFSGKATPGLYSVLFSPWYSSAQRNIIVMANLYEKASYYEHTCMVFPSL